MTYGYLGRVCVCIQKYIWVCTPLCKFKKVCVLFSPLWKASKEEKSHVEWIFVTTLPLSNWLCDLGQVTSLSLGFHNCDLELKLCLSG